MNGLGDALGRLNSSMGEKEEPEGMGKEPEGGEGSGEVIAVHAHKHKSGKHSTHKVMEGKEETENEMHEPGQGGEDCPMC